MVVQDVVDRERDWAHLRLIIGERSPYVGCEQVFAKEERWRNDSAPSSKQSSLLSSRGTQRGVQPPHGCPRCTALATLHGACHVARTLCRRSARRAFLPHARSTRIVWRCVTNRCALLRVRTDCAYAISPLRCSAAHPFSQLPATCTFACAPPPPPPLINPTCVALRSAPLPRRPSQTSKRCPTPMHHTAYPAAAYSTNGGASYQHDRHLIHHLSNRSLYLIADGHGPSHTGHIVSQHITETFPTLLHRHASAVYHPHNMIPALTNAVLELDRSAIQVTSAARLYAGSTLCALFRVHHLLYCINVGDSRALLLRSHDVKQLSVDHRCDVPRERHRIERAGGRVVGGMLNGYISMSRAIGDDDLKAHRNITPFPHVYAHKQRFGEELFIAQPDVHSFSLHAQDLVCVIASDGVWNKLDNQQLAKLVRKQIARRMSAESIAKQIVNKAAAKGSKDNITALVTFLWPYDHVYNAVVSSRLRRTALVTEINAKTDDDVDVAHAPRAERVHILQQRVNWRSVRGQSPSVTKSPSRRFAGVRGRLVDAWQSRSLSTLY